MNLNCRIGSDLVCSLCGRPVSGQHVRRNCPARPTPPEIIAQADEAAREFPPDPDAITPGPALPPVVTRVWNFFASAASHVAAGMPQATDEQIAARFAICQGCEFLTDGACSRCGCPVVRERRFVSKLAWANESCPEGKWGPVAD